MNMNEKKSYNTPVLIVHGDVEKITQACNFNNADSPSGTNNAFPGGGLPCS